MELHPYNQQPKLVRFCAEHGIVVTGYSPLGAGSYVGLGMAKGADSPLNNPVVKQIAAKHRKSAAQVVLRWGLQRGYSLVPKSSKVERLQVSCSHLGCSCSMMGSINSLFERLMLVLTTVGAYWLYRP